MARPQTLCKLEKGKLLGAFDGFVDTFNWIVDFCANLKGDKDTDGKKDGITIDRTDDDYPIVRCSGSGSGSGGDLCRAFYYNGASIGPGAVVVGRRPFLVSGTAVASGYTGYKTIRVVLTSSDPVISWTDYSPFSAPDGAESYLPCYHFTNGAIDGDYRGSFVVPAYE